MERVRRISETYPVFRQLERATGGQARAEFCFVGAAVAMFFVLFSKCIASPLTDLFALLVIAGPATSVIVGKAPQEMGAVKHVVSYLLTFGVFTLVDSLAPFVHKKVPFYYHGKLVFFYYLSMRKTQFTEYLNSSLYHPLSDVLRKMCEVDGKEKIKAAQSEATKKAKELSESAAPARPAKEE